MDKTTNQTPDLSVYGVQSEWLRSPRGQARRRLLVAYAHPDDESFGNGGTIARYVAAGVEVHYVCATRGECGGAPGQMLDGYPDIAALRTAEMACAARALGLTAVHYLGYRDSGMPGSPDNLRPGALVQASLDVVTGQVTALIRAIKPQVVLTFGSYGGYGHPDHIAMHRATVAAFRASRDGSRYAEHVTGGLAPYSPRKLYYSTFGSRALLNIAVPVLQLLGRNPRKFGTNGDIDLVKAAKKATPATTVVNCAPYVGRKMRAWRCHASQLGDMGMLERLPRFARRLFLQTEYFTRVVPAWRPGERRERDLFAGIGEPGETQLV